VNNTPNKYIFRSGKDIYLELNNGYLRLDEVQLEGKRRMSGKDYLFLAN
jgi:methionyl-tRNA formyltransferase